MTIRICHCGRCLNRGACARGSLHDVLRSVHGAISLVAAISTTVFLAACGSSDEPGTVSTHVAGVIELRADADSVPDYRGFVLRVMSDTDTLATTETDRSGSFRMDVTAPRRAIYLLEISRHGQLVKRSEIVLAEADTATLRLRLPDGSRPLVIRSRENAALIAYRNTLSTHNTALQELARSDAASVEAGRFRHLQTAEMLWRLRTQFARTIGGEVAGSESVILLEGWDDSLALARADSIEPGTWKYDEVVRVVRRAESRRSGVDAAVSRLRTLQEGTREERAQAIIESEIVAAYIDSSRYEQAGTAAGEMERRFQGTTWQEWAQSARYEMEKLTPGNRAPVFAATTWDGYPFDASEHFDRLTLLEFVKPLEAIFLHELQMRDAMVGDLPPGFLRVVTVSVDPDSVVNEALFDEHELPGSVGIGLPDGPSSIVARLYNVKLVPKRFLIRDGTILARYSGPAIQQIQLDLDRLARGRRPSL